MMKKVVISVLPHHVLMSVVILKDFSLNSSLSNHQQHHNLVVTLKTFPHY